MPMLTAKSRYLTLIRSGQKTSTIRMTCKVQPGDVLTFTDYRTSVRTRCFSTERLPLSELTDADAQADGFVSLDELLTALRSHYALTPDTRVWIIRFVLNDSPQSDLAFD